MADEIKKTVIIKIDLDIATYKKELQLANSGVAVLTKNQTELKKVGKESSAQFADNQVKLAKYSKEVSDLKRVINNATEANAEQTGSNKQLSASISVQTYELNKKSEAWKTETNEGRLAVENLLNTTEALKANKAAVADNRMNVGNYENSVSGLKQELKAAKSEMIAVAAAMGMDSKEFQIAANKAGAVKDKIDDINTAAKATATGSDLGKFRNQLKDVGASLMDLDFKEAAERAKGLSASVKNFSWSGMVSGGKAMASTLYEVGASMMALPIFWLIAGVAAVTAGLIAWGKAGQEAAQQQVDATNKVGERFSALYDAQIRFQKAIGKETEKSEMEKFKMQKQTIEKSISILEEQAGTVKGLNDDQKKQIEELRKSKLENIIDIKEAELNSITKIKEAREKAIKEEQKETDEYSKNYFKETEKEEKRNLERLESNKKLLDQLLQQKVDLTNNSELKDIAQAALNKSRAIKAIIEEKGDIKNKDEALKNQELLFQKEIADIKEKYFISNKEKSDKEIKDNADKKAKLIKDEEDALANYIDLGQKKIDATNAEIEKTREIRAKAQAKEDELREKNNQSIREGVKQLEQQLSDSIFSAQSARLQRETEMQNSSLDEKHKSEADKLQANLTSGAITQAEFDAATIANQKRFEDEQLRIKKDAFEKDKKLKIQQVGINLVIELSNIAIAAAGNPTNAVTYGAAGISQYAIQAGIAIARAAIETGTISSAQFATGGAVSGKRIGFNDGKSISRGNGDNLLATVRTGEVILNENQQAMLGGANTFRSIGVPGFAGGGFTDGGAMANRLSSPIDQTITAINQQRRLNRTLPPPVVVVSDIINGVDTHVKVVLRGDI